MYDLEKRLIQGDWYVICADYEQYKRLMKICHKVGFGWSSGQSCLDDQDFNSSYPVEIGADNEYNKNMSNDKLSLVFSTCDSFSKQNKIDNITSLVFSDEQLLIEVMNNNSWFVKCLNSSQMLKLLTVCEKIGFRWVGDGKLPTQYFPNVASCAEFPISIGVDAQYNEENGFDTGICYSGDDFISESTKIEILDLTNSFFDVFQFSTLLTDVLNNIDKDKILQIRDKNGEWFEPDLTQYRLINKQTPLNISQEIWDLINPIFKYAAMDDDGEIYFYEFEPDPDPEWDENSIEGFYWNPIEGAYSASLFDIDTTNIIPSRSLTKRP